MQSTHARPSSFPYLVALAFTVVILVFAGIGIYNWQNMTIASGADHETRLRLLYSMLGSSLTALAISVAFGFACTQWILERRHIAGLPGYGAVAMGLVKALIGAALAFSWPYIMKAMMYTHDDSVRIQLIASMTAIIGYLMSLVAAMFPIWLIFRLLRSKDTPASPHPAELRGRALLIFTLFAWSWILIVVKTLMPMVPLYYAADMDALPLVIYAGSFGLVLPAFLGALIGLPRTMPVTRPVRLWLAGTLAVLVCALVMVATTFAMLRLGMVFNEDFQPGAGFSALVGLIWFVVSILLCWLLVKALTNRGAVRSSRIDQMLPG